MNDHGFKMTPSIKGKNSVEDGIEFIKSYDVVIHPRCTNLISEFTAYSYKVDPRTDEVLPVLVDQNNHGIDALRYGLEDERHKANPLILPSSVLQRLKLAPRNRFAGYSIGPPRNRFARSR
jgi:phage terminase large subunit